MNRLSRRTARESFAALVSAVACLAALSAPILAGAQALAGSPGTIITVAGDGNPGFCGDGQLATNACLSYPFNIAISDSGVLYIADGQNNRVRKVDNATGVISTVAGTGATGFCGDGGPAINACLNDPSAVALDSEGSLLVADAGNSVIRKIAASGIISTVAGTPGVAGFCGDGGPAINACINLPFGIAVDSHNNLLIADTFNSRVREVGFADRKISTVAGNGTFAFCGDDGRAVSACLNRPFAVTVDKTGQVLIADTFNNRVRLVKGVNISTVVGNGSARFCGDGGNALLACLDTITGIALDSAGNLFISDSSNSRVREVANGTIFTFAGTGSASFCGDGGPATSACLDLPWGVASDSNDNIFIADRLNDRVREVFALVASGDGDHGNSPKHDNDLGHFECSHQEANGCGRFDASGLGEILQPFFPATHGKGKG